MKKKYFIIGAVVVVLLGYGSYINSSNDGAQETGNVTEQVEQNDESEQMFQGGGVLLI